VRRAILSGSATGAGNALNGRAFAMPCELRGRIGHLQCPADQPQLLDCAGACRARKVIAAGGEG
jgi:hypothetical protein